MTIFPDKDTFIKLASSGNLIPVCADLMADLETPVSVYAKLRTRGPSFLLESVSGGERVSRYSFAGSRPRKIITAWKNETVVAHRNGTVEKFPTPPDPLHLIEETMAPFKTVKVAGMPPFQGGAVGFVGYEYIHCIEPTVPLAERDELNVPLLQFMLMDSVVMFDHARQSIRLCVNAEVNDTAAAGAIWEQAAVELRALLETLQAARPLAPTALVSDVKMTPPQGNFTREDFEKAVEKTREYIFAGDGVQVVLSQRFEKKYDGSPLDLYRVLRYINPSPYMFILESGTGFTAVGASPEVNVRLTNGTVEIRPIAGTRHRGDTENEDKLLERELLGDTKERAEHLMLVDLARNDIGRVCKTGTVEVSEYAAIERYSHVMHIVSQVTGILQNRKNAFDLFRAIFPAGTLSGAPKIRAMQIIAELENTQRGFYGGAMGYFSFDGNHDSCIAIRSALLKNGTAFIQAGAGITADSVPASEYRETINKSMSVMKAVAIAEEMEDTFT